MAYPLSIASSLTSASVGLMAGAAEPLFETDSLRFFQDSDVMNPVRAFHALEQPGGGMHLGSNERFFQRFYPATENAGGVLLGVGSLQNLNLAAVSRASGFIGVDADSNVALSLAMLLPLIPTLEGPREFAEVARNFVRRDAPADPYLQHIPAEYQDAFFSHIDHLRRYSMTAKRFRKFVDAYERRPDTILGLPEYYERVASMIQLGGVSVIYGNLFSDELPALVDGAMSYYDDPIRTIYCSNAIEWCAESDMRGDLPISPLLELASRPYVDSQGRVLMTTERGASPAIRAAEEPDHFVYHAHPTGEVFSALDRVRSLDRWLSMWKRDPQVVANYLNQFDIAE